MKQIAKHDPDLRGPWSRGMVIGLARFHCHGCLGLGFVGDDGMGQVRRGRHLRPCGCALRGIFRACYRKFQDVGHQPGGVVLHRPAGPGGESVYERPFEDYAADFCGIAKRELSKQDHDLFTLHWIYGLVWSNCCRRLQITKGDFYHRVYMIEERLGRAFVETKPYGIYPFENYFAARRPADSARSTELPAACVIP